MRTFGSEPYHEHVRRALGLVGLLSCGSEDVVAPEPSGACPERAIAAGPGVCIDPGVPPERCAAGFAPRDRGCDPVLPPGPCSPGTLALPGETSCREVAPCPAAPFGDLPDEPTIQHVSAAFAGNSDGSAASPWRTIADAVAAAAPGAIVAVADGEYDESLVLSGKPVRLWGRCPGTVVVRGVPSELLAVFVTTGASGSELRRLAVTGPAGGVGVSGAEDVLLEQVWIHDTGSPALAPQDVFGPTSVTVRASLVEAAGPFGIYASGSGLAVEDSVVRGTVPSADPGTGMAMLVRGGTGGAAPSTTTLRRVVLEGNHEAGLLVLGSTALVEGSVIRDTAAAPGSGDGYGIASRLELDGTPSTVEVRASVIERNGRTGLFAGGSSLLFEASVVRDSLPAPDAANDYGWGLAATALGADATLTVRASLVERTTEAGVLFFGAAGSVDSTVVRDVAAVAAGRGLGLNVQRDGARTSSVVVSGSLVERTFEQGVLVVDSQADVDRSVVRATAAAAGGIYGDGAAVVAYPSGGALLSLSGSRLEANARAGLAAFGAAAEIASTILSCNAVDLDGEVFAGADYSLVDRGGNVCACGETTTPCVVKSANLEPPEPL
jgi:hypothetical protein